MQKTILCATNLAVTLGRTPIVHDISLSMQEAQLVALLGPNGAGKTTLLKTLAGLTPTTSGTINFDSIDITALPVHERVAHGVVYLPQHSALFNRLSIIDNLTLVFDYHPYWQHKIFESFRGQAQDLLQHVGLAHICTRTAGVLSGGQKRKLEVVRALLMRPRVLLCDEPFAGVDPKSTAELTQLFTHIVKEQHISVLLSDHNVVQLLAHADYVYMVLAGRIVVHGTSEQVQSDATTRKHYLGSDF